MRFHYLIRRTHRWLGVTIGLQLLAWTLGGLYFAWSNMDEVHGDYEKAAPALLSTTVPFVPPTALLDSLRQREGVNGLTELRLVSVLDKAHWQITYPQNGQKKVCLADATTGTLRPPLSESEAADVARMGYAGAGKIVSTRYLTEVGPHHEYRESPLPAYAFAFDDDRHTTVYVATALGTAQKFRNRPWRRFDFLWMLHTMDFQGRDHIGNWLLRAFSVFGLVTVCSGFALFWVSKKKKLATN